MKSKRWREAWERAQATAECGRDVTRIVYGCVGLDGDVEDWSHVFVVEGMHYEAIVARHDVLASLALDGAPIEELP